MSREVVFNAYLHKYKEMGYEISSISVSHLRANMYIFIIMPICIAMYIIYSVVYGIDKNIYDREIEDYAIFFIAAFIISPIIHEIIHGVTWAISCDNKFKSIHFGVHIKTFTPWCGCSEPLSYWRYTLGTAMPAIIIGIIPYLIGFVTKEYGIMALGIVNFWGGSGDIMMIWKTRKYRGWTMLDYPNLVGCMAVRKGERNGETK